VLYAGVVCWLSENTGMKIERISSRKESYDEIDDDDED